jgi:hypothetical protein
MPTLAKVAGRIMDGSGRVSPVASGWSTLLRSSAGPTGGRLMAIGLFAAAFRRHAGRRVPRRQPWPWPTQYPDIDSWRHICASVLRPGHAAAAHLACPRFLRHEGVSKAGQPRSGRGALKLALGVVVQIAGRTAKPTHSSGMAHLAAGRGTYRPGTQHGQHDYAQPIGQRSPVVRQFG